MSYHLLTFTIKLMHMSNSYLLGHNSLACAIAGYGTVQTSFILVYVLRICLFVYRKLIFEKLFFKFSCIYLL